MTLQIFRSSILAAAILLVTAACAPDAPEPSPTPEPTPAVLRVDLAVELNPLRPDIAACAARTDNTGVLVFEAIEPALPQDLESVTLTLGEVPGWEGAAALLGVEHIITAASVDSPPAALTMDQVARLYTGEPGALPGRSAPVEIWIPLEGTASRRALDRLMGENSYAVEGFLAPDPGVATAVLAENPDAIGVLPSAWMTPDLKLLLKIGELPVLALTAEEPAGNLRQFLGCLQETNIFPPESP